MIPKNLKDIKIDDLKSLIDNSVKEGKSIDYKLAVNVASDSDRKEFLYDVSSFANASGGDIIFGVRENEGTGYPEELVGLEGNMDELRQKFDSIIRDCLAPRLAGVTSNYYQLDSGRHVFVLRIPKSWNLPHQVTFKGTGKFYSRNNAGKYALDVTELREAFMADYSTRKEMSRFVDGRLSTILANEGPIELLEHPKLVLHAIPLLRFNSDHQTDLKRVFQDQERLWFMPIGDKAGSKRYNFDGVISHVVDQDGGKSYVQIFRNGVLETVNCEVLDEWNKKKLDLFEIERLVVQFFNRTKSLYKFLEIDSPTIAFLTITGVKGYNADKPNGLVLRRFHPIDKENLRFPELLIEDWDLELPQLLKPWFDALWNSIGIPESQSYKDGTWAVQ